MLRIGLGMFRLIVFSAIFFCGYVYCVQVCDDCKYYTKPNKKHCHDNPDGERNLTEILKNWPSVKVEEHRIFTEDGYQLLIVRAYKKLEKDPIVLAHGLYITPLAWANRGKKSLAHYLIEEGHEVWIIHFRGSSSELGLKHKNLTKDDPEFMNISFDEVGYYDIDVIMQLVKEKSAKKAIMITYGLGSSASFVYCITRSQAAAANLKGVISLGPIAYLSNMKSVIRYMLPLAEEYKTVIHNKYKGSLSLDWIRNCTSDSDCYLDEVIQVPIFGDDFQQIDPEYVPIKKLQNYRKEVGIEFYVHMAQLLKSNEFLPRDLGTVKNLEKYGKSDPQPYKIADIKVPQAVFVGKNDWFTTEKDVRTFYDQLSLEAQCGFEVIDYDKWNHKDFFEAKDVVELLYGPLYEVVTEMSEEKCAG